MSVFSSTWNFVKRHRGKILLFSSAIGGYVMLKKVLSSFEQSWEKSSTKDFISEARKKEIHFESTTETFNSTVLSLSPKMLRTLDKLLETETLLTELRGSKLTKERKLVIWENIKIRIFTRVLSEIYCISLFLSYLRMQLSVISGYMYVDAFRNGQLSSTASSSSSSSSTINSSIQAKYLSLLINFYQEGIESVVNSVKEAVQATIGEISLKENLSFNDLKVIFEKIKSIMAFSLTSSASQLSLYLIKPHQINAIIKCNGSAGNGAGDSVHMKSVKKSDISNNEAKIIEKILTETQDILESDDFRRVLNSAIDVGYSVMLDVVLSCFIKTEGANNLSSKPSSTSSSVEKASASTSATSKFANPHLNSIPLAKLLPGLKEALQDRNNTNDTLILVKHLICLDVLNCFAANVYEAFCEP